MQSIEKVNLTHLHKCDQVWEDMPPNEKGRLCQKCQNTIIDFRNLSDREVAEIHTFTPGKVCGLYDPKQLELHPNKTRKRKGFRGSLVGLFSLFITMNAHAQTDTTATKTVQLEPDYKNEKLKNINNTNNKILSKESIIISGTLRNEMGEPIDYAAVYIKGTTIGVISNWAGEYHLDVSKYLDSVDRGTLVFTLVGYATKEIPFDKTALLVEGNREINVVFKDNEPRIIEFYVTRRAPLHKRIWYRIKRIFRKKN